MSRTTTEETPTEVAVRWFAGFDVAESDLGPVAVESRDHQITAAWNGHTANASRWLVRHRPAGYHVEFETIADAWRFTQRVRSMIAAAWEHRGHAVSAQLDLQMDGHTAGLYLVSLVVDESEAEIPLGFVSSPSGKYLGRLIAAGAQDPTIPVFVR